MTQSKAVAQQWDTMFQTNTWAKYPSEEVIRFIQRTYGNTQDRKGIRCLDLGCGNGTTSWYLAREGFQVDGLDGSQTAIQFAEALLAHENLQASFSVGLVQQVPYGDQTFDVIIDNACTTSLPLSIVKETALEVKRTLKPGGWYYGVYFGPETTIDGTRDLPNDPAFYSHLTAGPVKKAPTVRIFEEKELRDIFGFLGNIAVDYTLRTVFDRKEQVQLWIVTGQNA